MLLPLHETGVGEEAVLDDVLVHLPLQGVVVARALELLLVDEIESLEAPIVNMFVVEFWSGAKVFTPVPIVLGEEAGVQVATCFLDLCDWRGYRAHGRVIHRVDKPLVPFLIKT